MPTTSSSPPPSPSRAATTTSTNSSSPIGSPTSPATTTSPSTSSVPASGSINPSPWWLRQNLILFVRRTALESNPALLAESKINRPLAIIHPDLYLARLQSAHQVQQSYAKLMTLFQQGGNFSVHRTPDGNLNISRLP